MTTLVNLAPGLLLFCCLLLTHLNCLTHIQAVRCEYELQRKAAVGGDAQLS